ncbi:hypothetical protein CC78DRAFT_595270 [Lojkania enalia]|uniref:Uncharacterized protein n=1 Tax=Lojkania enalia TaxID=147567 RepID=A0A9P4KDJ7_9PLEO|nr:hypothetical protein CC78DRAFT_595270 [Didymosphaeria enalia]
MIFAVLEQPHSRRYCTATKSSTARARASASANASVSLRASLWRAGVRGYGLVEQRRKGWSTARRRRRHDVGRTTHRGRHRRRCKTAMCATWADRLSRRNRGIHGESRSVVERARRRCGSFVRWLGRFGCGIGGLRLGGTGRICPANVNPAPATGRRPREQSSQACERERAKPMATNAPQPAVLSPRKELLLRQDLVANRRSVSVPSRGRPALSVCRLPSAVRRPISVARRPLSLVPLGIVPIVDRPAALRPCYCCAVAVALSRILAGPAIR